MNLPDMYSVGRNFLRGSFKLPRLVLSLRKVPQRQSACLIVRIALILSGKSNACGVKLRAGCLEGQAMIAIAGSFAQLCTLLASLARLRAMETCAGCQARTVKNCREPWSQQPEATDRVQGCTAPLACSEMISVASWTCKQCLIFQSWNQAVIKHLIHIKSHARAADRARACLYGFECEAVPKPVTLHLELAWSGPWHSWCSGLLRACHTEPGDSLLTRY